MAFDTVFDLHQRLADLADQVAVVPAPASPVAAMEMAKGLYATIDRLEAAASTCVQTVDAGEARADGYPSTIAWLRQSCRMLGSRASERVMVARVVKNLTDADTGKAEPILLEVADDLGPDDAAVRAVVKGRWVGEDRRHPAPGREAGEEG